MNINNNEVREVETDSVEGRSSHLGRGLWRVGVVVTTILLAVGALSLINSPAEASTVRPGARLGQVDVLLDSVETQRAATSYWGSQTVCWGVTAGAGAVGRIAGAVLANLSCTSMVAVCAAQAYVAHRRAGMTFYPFGFFCWKY
jgi:hypothetical protein